LVLLHPLVDVAHAQKVFLLPDFPQSKRCQATRTQADSFDLGKARREPWPVRLPAPDGHH
jgi:hypothetical protein